MDNFATKNLEIYFKLHKELEDSNYLSKKLKKSFENFDDLLDFYNAKYLISGLESLRAIEDNSIDYIYSHSVLEHVRKCELNELIKEMYRVLKPNGVISHNINYKDHLDESLNNLRFNEKLWESNFFAESGFYTNRIPAVEMHSLFKENGFCLRNELFGKWEKLPLERKKINKIFKDFTDQELSIPTSSFIATKKN